MTFTKSQKICFGLLTAGLGALVADRAFGGSAAADPQDAPVNATVTQTTEWVAPAKPEAVAPLTLAGRLRSLSPDSGTEFPDAFAIPTGWSRTASGRPVDASAVAFEAAHKLKAVISNGQRGGVLLDDRLVAVGESVDGFELVEVRQYHAVFLGKAGRILLALPSAAEAAKH